MTFPEILISLRQRLVQAWQENDKPVAEDIFTTLSMLREISYESNNEALTGIITDLLDSARDIVMESRMKSNIPSVDAIQSVFPPNTKAS